MFARFFIDRPVFAWVLSLVIVIIGGVAVFFLPVDQYPPITPPTVTVSANYPGASAEVVADTIAAPIEQQVNGVENMLYMSSQSTNDGNYTLTITFEIGTDLNTAQVLVQNRVALAMPLLPQQVQLQGVTTKKRSPTILFAINLISPAGRYDDLYLSNYATLHVLDDLLRVKGVGDITLFGQRSYSMRIWLDPDKLSARNLTAVDVVNAVRAQNTQVAVGQVGQEPVPRGQEFQLTMSTLGRLTTEQQFGDIILKASGSAGVGTTVGSAAPSAGPTAGLSPGTTPIVATAPEAATAAGPDSPVVHLRDVARIELGAQNYDISSRLDGQPAAGMGVFLLPGSNALEVASAVKARIAELQNTFPPGVEYRILYDTTPFIRQSVDEVVKTLFYAVLLVALVVLLFLQDWRAMILPMIDVPVSLVGTFAVMALFSAIGTAVNVPALQFSLNNLTLFGLVLAIGIVVDDAIVVLENIERLIATGLDARSATLRAMEEITGPIIAITLVLVAVFLPSAFVPGLTGHFYRQFAITICVAMVISAVNAMSLTPSRAVAIFKTEETGAGRHKYVREALPWWIFGVIGAWLGWQLLGPAIANRHLPIPDVQFSVFNLRLAIGALVGLLVGGLIGWFSIRLVNAALSWFFRQFNRLFDWVTGLYGRTVARMVRLSMIVIVVYCGLLFLTYWTMHRARTGFIPTQDQGYLLLNAQLPDAASVQRTRDVMQQIDKIARSVPGVAHTVGVAGQSFLLGTNGSNLGSMFIVLEPFDARQAPDRYDAIIAQKIQERCALEIEDAIVSVFRAPPVRGLANAGGFKLQVVQRGYMDLNALQAQTEQLISAAQQDPLYAGVFTIFRANTPQLFIDIDRTKVESLQVPVQDVFTTLEACIGGLYVNDFNKFGRTWQVRVQAASRFRTSAEKLKQLKVRNALNQMVPLGTVVRIEEISGPVFVMRYNMYTSAAVNGNLAPGVSSGDAIEHMEQLARQLGIQFEWTELFFLQLQAGNVTLWIFALGTGFVYLILAAKYESWRLPFAVILVVPLCMLAAVTGMMISNLPVDIFVQIGLLVLVGLASKNAILIVEYARQLHRDGRSLRDAAVEASRIRFRPIIMTSLAFILGVLPLVLATGAAAEMRQSLGTAVFSGMIGVTIFGIFLTPVFFHVILRLRAERPTLSSSNQRAADEAARQ